MSAPKKRGIPLFWPDSKSGDGRSERALKAGNLPPTLEPTAIPRREPPSVKPPKDIRFNRITPADGQGGSSFRPPAGMSGLSAAVRSNSSAGPSRAAAQATQSGNAVASSSSSYRPAMTSTSSSTAQVSGRPSTPANLTQPSRRNQQPTSAAGPQEPLFYRGPPTQPSTPLSRPTPAAQARPPPPEAPAPAAAYSSSSSSSNTPSTRAPYHLPPQPPPDLQSSLPFERAPPLQRPSQSGPSSSTAPNWSAHVRPTPKPNGAAWRPPLMRPHIAAGPKAAVPFPYPMVRRESGSGSSSPAAGNPGSGLSGPPLPLLPQSSTSAGPSGTGSASTGRLAVYDAVPLTEHEALLSRPSSRNSERPNDKRQPVVEHGSSSTTPADIVVEKGKGKEIAQQPRRTAALSAPSMPLPPADTNSIPPPSATQAAQPRDSLENTAANGRQFSAPSSAPAQVKEPKALGVHPPAPPEPSVPPPPLPPTPPPLPLSGPQGPDSALNGHAAANANDGSSDDEDDVEAALLEAQRKLAELQEKKRLKALRKSLAGSEQRSEVSQSPAPASAATSTPALAPVTTSVDPGLGPATVQPLQAKTPTLSTTAVSGPSATDPIPPPLQHSALPPPPPTPPLNVEPLPKDVDTGPQPFGTSSQVVFSDLPPDTRELALRRFIGGTLISVTHVDFQETFALVTFSNPHDASEVVRMLSDEDFTAGHRIAMDLASNLELVNEPVDSLSAGTEGGEPRNEAEIPPSQPDIPSPVARPLPVMVKQQPPSPHDSLFSSQRNSPPPQTDPNTRRRQSSATSVDEALDEPVWAAKKRRRVESPARQPPCHVKEEESENVVDLTLSSDDERQPTASSAAKAKESKPIKEKRLKYSAPEIKTFSAKKLSAPRLPNNKTRWIAVSDAYYACAYHKGVVEFFNKQSLEPRPTVRFEMAEGESVEGITFAGNRLIVGRQRRTADEMRPQISWVSTPTLRKNKAHRVQSGTIDDQAHSGMGVACIAPLPSRALTAETTLSTSVFATGGFDHAVKLWKFDDDGRRKLWALHSLDHTSRVDALIWDDQKKVLYSAGADGRILGFALAKAKMSDWVLPRSTTGVFQLHLSSAHPALLLAETNRVNQQFSLYDTRSSPSRTPIMFGEGESGSANGAEGGNKGRSKYVRGSWQDNLFASADQNGNLRIWDVRHLKSCHTIEIQAAATAHRQVILDGDNLLDLTGDALFVRKWRLL